MRIFDFFRKKKDKSSFPENELEKLLINAANDVSARSSFYEKLLRNELIVLTNSNSDSEQGTKILEEDTTVQFLTFDSGQIPIFSSTNRIFDKGVVKEQVSYMGIKGQDLFEMTKGANFILNPYSDYGKELTSHEIESLLNGSIFEHSKEVVIEEETQVLIGQPAKYPTELVNALSKYFKNKKSVKAAYVAAIKMDKSESLPHLIIAIDTEGSMSSITNEAGSIAEQYIEKDEIIDFLQIDRNGGISDYFLNQGPFYKRK